MVVFVICQTIGKSRYVLNIIISKMQRKVLYFVNQRAYNPEGRDLYCTVFTQSLWLQKERLREKDIDSKAVKVEEKYERHDLYKSKFINIK